MNKITRNVRDLNRDERRVYETALGESLRDNQQVILQVINVGSPEQGPEINTAQSAEGLPDWCNVYEGLTEQEIEDVEKVILDRNGWTRDSQ